MCDLEYRLPPHRLGRASLLIDFFSVRQDVADGFRKMEIHVSDADVTMHMHMISKALALMLFFWRAELLSRSSKISYNEVGTIHTRRGGRYQGTNDCERKELRRHKLYWTRYLL